MKTNTNIKQIIYLFFIGLIVSSCGEELISTEYEEYLPKKLANNDGSVLYPDITSYPIIGEIISEVPTTDIEGERKFLIADVQAPEGSTYIESRFNIDRSTGVITYNNNGELSPGTYYVDVDLGYVLGVVTYEQALKIDILSVPISLEVDNTNPSVGIFEQGIVATVSYTDTSGSGLITEVEYSLVDAPQGFSIDSNTGEISKSFPVSSGENPISVKATTNLGAVIFDDLTVVMVGDEPTIAYTQMDEATPLTSVTLSPWTAYTTAIPSLVGMTAASYEIILPETLTTDGIVANEDGSISILADQNIPVGTYALGVKATNASGIEVEFENIFEIQVENRWEVSKLFEENFDDGTTGPLDPVNPTYPEYSGYTLGTTSSWQKVVVTHATNPTIEGLRVFNPGTDNHYLVRSIDITIVKALKISFEEQFGYNNNFVVTYQRALYAGESTADLESGTFNSANWTAVMPIGDPRWPGSVTWPTRSPNIVNDIEVDLSSINGNDLKIAWFLGNATEAQNGQYIIDGVSAEYAMAFPAEEN
ncbi:hypothetical protein [Aegicerativicinus sediminis]